MLVDCKDQKEIDYFWEKLSAVQESEQCGWCKDRFGFSWQIVPDMEKSRRAMLAMLKMKKIVIADLENA
jgi:predicted 3-demethylubiquinone-9 3-methyltransferase (glyoxalase superfamily)